MECTKIEEKTPSIYEFFKEHELNIFKCKDVKSPAKSWDAAAFLGKASGVPHPRRSG